MADLGIYFSQEKIHWYPLVSTDTSHYISLYRKFAVPLFLGHPVLMYIFDYYKLWMNFLGEKLQNSTQYTNRSVIISTAPFNQSLCRIQA